MGEKKIEVVELSECELDELQGGLLPGFDEVEIDGGNKPKGLESGGDPLEGLTGGPLGF